MRSDSYPPDTRRQTALASDQDLLDVVVTVDALHGGSGEVLIRRINSCTIPDLDTVRRVAVTVIRQESREHKWAMHGTIGFDKSNVEVVHQLG
jgi:hypothetical protein